MKHPVLLIHGLFGHLNDPVITRTIAPHHVVAPDLLGYGRWRYVNTDGLTLEAQADHLARLIDGNASGQVNVVGHSVGGAVAVLLAHRHPELAASLILVEGNFTLRDAFWSSKIADTPLSEVEDIIAGYRADPGAWIADADVTVTEWSRALAQEWLDNQPASTIRAQARAVVEATGAESYLSIVRSQLDRDLPVHLVSGEWSRANWDVPSWVAAGVRSETVIPGTGHLMMVQEPEAFGAAIRAACL